MSLGGTMNTTTTSDTATYTVINAMTDIIAAPSRALDEIRQHPRWFWWPLLISLAVTIGVFAWYYHWVDFEWFTNEIIRQAIADGTPADQAGQISAFMSPGKQVLFTAIAIVVISLVIYTIQAAYFHIVNKVAGDASLGYGQWFSYSVWTAFVGIVNALVMFVVILLADSNQLPIERLNPLSMNSLFIHAGAGDAWFTWGNSLTLVHFWMLWLMTLGFSRWTGSSMTKSALVAVTPWVLIFGTWAIMIAT